MPQFLQKNVCISHFTVGEGLTPPSACRKWPMPYYLLLFAHPSTYSWSNYSKSFTSNLKGLSATGSSDGS